jgi:Transglycosylase SLT domain
MNLRTTTNSARSRAAADGSSRRRPPSAVRRPSLYLAVAAAGAVMVGVVTGGEPAAQAEPAPLESVSVAEALGVGAEDAPAVADQLGSLESLAASRSERAAGEEAARKARAEADKAEVEKRAEAARKEAARKEAERQEAAREEAARQEAARQEAARAEAARAEAARQEAARQEAAASAPSTAPAASAPAPAGSFHDYALSKLGGDGTQFSCLENLWGKESGWNPNAQNPTSSAYGIAQFLDSTWAGTGIAKTADGYRQIDAGLIYINNRYGSPCAAWAHSQANNWY